MAIRIKTKISGLVIIAAIGMTLVGWLGINSSLEDKKAFDEAQYREAVAEDLLLFREEMTELMRRSYQVASRALLPAEQQPAELQRVLPRYEAALKRMEEVIAKIDAVKFTQAESNQQWAEAKQAWSTFGARDRELIAQLKIAVDSPSPEHYQTLYNMAIKMNMERRGQTEILEKVVEDVRQRALEVSHHVIEESVAGTYTAIKLIVAVIIVMLVLMGILWWSLNTSVIKTIEKTRDLVLRVAQNRDLTLRLDSTAQDEVGEMARAFDTMLVDLKDAIEAIQGKVKEAGDAVSALSSAAEQVAASSAQQSQATSSMAAAVEEMTVSISTVSASANEAHGTAVEAGETSEQGGTIIGQTVDEMGVIAETVQTASAVIEQLGEKSEQISSVVQVIKDVADQTNLLALNAAIEAARAGEQGRGFAVVADEVRKLAERTAQSTADISGMVGEIQTSAKEAVEEMKRVVEQVGSGQTLAQDAGVHIRGIREGSRQVAEAISEISNALKEQTTASQEIAKNVESVAQMTDENNAAASTTAASAEQVRALSQGIVDTLHQFKV